MLPKPKLDRLNELARKAKKESLTKAEQTEQQALRAEYLANFRKDFRDQLNHIHVVDNEDDAIH